MSGNDITGAAIYIEARINRDDASARARCVLTTTTDNRVKLLVSSNNNRTMPEWDVIDFGKDATAQQIEESTAYYFSIHCMRVGIISCRNYRKMFETGGVTMISVDEPLMLLQEQIVKSGCYVIQPLTM